MPEVRSIFISDVHLGTRACQAERLLDFLREHPAQHLFPFASLSETWGNVLWGRPWPAAWEWWPIAVPRRSP